MKTQALVRLVAFAAAVITIACGDDDDPTPPVIPSETFRSTMDGASERPTARVTPATGTATYTLRRDTLYWDLVLTNITNVTAAHIHIGDATQAAGILLLLSTPASNTRMQGFVTRTGFTAPAAPNAGVTFDSLLALMRNGNSYTNVHTNNTGNDPTNNSGPGDFPGGEIRGQIAKVP
jgi:hypothetical protein